MPPFLALRGRRGPWWRSAAALVGALGVAAGALGVGAATARTAAAAGCTAVATSQALVAALARAAADPELSSVCLGPGRYRANLDVARRAPLTLRGSGAGATTLTPVTTTSVLSVGVAAHLTVVGLTISGGLSGDPGGVEGTGAGIHSAGDLTLEAVVVAHNGCALTIEPGHPGPAGFGSCGAAGVAHHTINAGGIYNTGTLTLVASSVVANSGLEGGGIMNNHRGVVRIEDGSHVDGNGGPGCSDGAGIYNHHDASLLVSHSTVSGNRTGSLDSSGGGLFNQAIGSARGRASLVDAIVSGNRVGHIGGGVLNRGWLTITGSTIDGNQAGDNGGGILNVGGLTVSASRLQDNRAGAAGLPYGGGAVYDAAGSAMTMTATTLLGNQARYGAAVDQEQGSAAISGSVVSGNGCRGACGDPTEFGAIYADVGAAVSVSGTQLSGNASTHGALFDNYGSAVRVSGSRVEGNQGGGIYNQGHPGDPAQLLVESSSLTGNRGAGGLLNYGDARLEQVVVTQNTSSAGGGGIDNAGGQLALEGTTVTGNRAPAGGGLLNNGGTVTTGSGDVFSGNHPDNCAGVTACPGGA